MSDQTLAFRIIIEKPVPGIFYGLQKGSANSYETLEAQVSDSKDLLFNVSLPIRKSIEGRIALHGPVIQGPANERFLYIDIGSYAGQKNAPVSGRMKIPLPEITEAILQAVHDGALLSAKVPGTKGGSLNIGTVKPFAGW